MPTSAIIVYTNNTFFDEALVQQPAYKQIQAYILSQIDKGILTPAQQIPTEMALAKQFSVSRMTVNRAIVELSQQKILTRTAGKGTFVTEQKNELPLINTVDFSEEVRQRGNDYHAEVLIHNMCQVFDELAMALGITDGAEAGFCELVHFENGTPIILERRYVNLIHAPDFIDQDFTQQTPTAYLLKHFPLTEIEHAVEAILADTETTAKLKLGKSSACLKISRRTWSEQVLISYAELTAVNYRLKSRYSLSAVTS